MLGKLMKYDMKYMARILPWLYLGAVGISVFLCIVTLVIPFDFLSGFELLIQSGSTMAVQALLIITVVFIVIRIYRSLLSDEAYLTFTLPVKNSKIIDSKIFAGAIWSFISMAVSFLVYFIPQIVLDIRYGIEYPASEIPESASSVDLIGLLKELTFDGLLFLNVVVIAFLIPSLYTFCASVVHKAKRGRAFASVGMFIGILYAVIIVIISIISFIIISMMISYTTLLISPDLPEVSVFDSYFYAPLIPLAITVPLTLVSWLVSKRIANKKLNLL